MRGPATRANGLPAWHDSRPRMRQSDIDRARAWRLQTVRDQMQASRTCAPELRDAIARSFTVRTPRGGFHHYFRGQGPTTAKAIGPGIDTRGGYVDERTGKLKSIGYVVLPGSKTKAGAKTVDGEYQWISG